MTAKAKAAAKQSAAADRATLDEHRAVARMRQAALQAASSDKGAARVELPPAFSLCADRFTPVATIAGNGHIDASKPFVISATNSPELTSMLLDSAIQQSLTQFAGKYKRKESTAASGKYFEVMAIGPAKKNLETFLGKVCGRVKEPVVKIQSIVPGFDKALWTCGYSANYTSINIAPNACAMIRVLAMGEINCILINLVDLVKALDGAFVKLSDIKEFVSSLGNAKYTEIVDSGCAFHHVKQQAEELLFVPAGWLLCETCSSATADGQAQQLIYGFRKSLFFNNGSDRDGYGQVESLMSNDGLDTSKMKKVQELFTASA